MNLNMHITSQSFVQSYRRFERNSYVHTSSTSDTAGIGFPHHYSHSSFILSVKKWLDFIQLFLAMSELKPSIWLKRKSWILPARKLQLFRIIFVLCGARCYDTR